jgi:hypothetical protein
VLERQLRHHQRRFFLALLRSSGYLFIGVWFANGMLISAHWLFLLGVSRFTETRLSRAWYLIIPAWLAMLLLPDWPQWSKTLLVVQSSMIALLTLQASWLLRPMAIVQRRRGTAALHPAVPRPVLPGQDLAGAAAGHADRPRPSVARSSRSPWWKVRWRSC